MFFIPGLKICGCSRAIEFSRLLYGLIVIIGSKSDCHTLGAFHSNAVFHFSDLLVSIQIY